jgi:hypothetical protein
MIKRIMTAENFADERSELPDAGQWAELIRGVPVTLAPPDIEHGTIVLNLSKAFSTYVHSGGPGYACFDLGLIVERRPDTSFSRLSAISPPANASARPITKSPNRSLPSSSNCSPPTNVARTSANG